MIEILKSILYGIVEGITEWLPISSTGHMILLEEIMPMNVSKSFWSMFLVVIQLGAILAVVVLYWNKIFPFKKNKEGKYTSVKSIWILWSKILVATIPAAIIGLALDDWIDAHLYNGFVVAIMLILVGVAFIYIENRNKDMCPSVNSLSALSYKDALIIGLFQVVAAVLPCADTGNIKIRSYDCWWIDDWCQSCSSCRIYFFLSDSSYVWSESIEVGEIWACV
mgnify:CR=1 FL=1